MRRRFGYACILFWLRPTGCELILYVWLSFRCLSICVRVVVCVLLAICNWWQYNSEQAFGAFCIWRVKLPRNAVAPFWFREMTQSSQQFLMDMKQGRVDIIPIIVLNPIHRLLRHSWSRRNALIYCKGANGRLC